jgi:hypothetical protein
MMPDYPDRKQVTERVIAALLYQQLYQSFWIDKWHISPYYATTHTVLALLKLKEYRLIEYSHAIEWISHTQHPDGSWGFFGEGTQEETAYALLALLHYDDHIGEVDGDLIKRGIDYLLANYHPDVRHPELWIAKTLYTPHNIVNAAILAAFALYDR